MVVVAEESDLMSNKDPNEHEKNVSKWINNNLNDLNTSLILKYIASSSKLSSAVKRYNLKDSFDRIGKNLNDYVHSNGIDYYNKRFSLYSTNEKERIVTNFTEQLNYITMTFIFLLSLINGLYIMSFDYTDALDCGVTPEEDSQYWVASFIQNYINENYKLLGDDCQSYLRQASLMKI